MKPSSRFSGIVYIDSLLAARKLDGCEGQNVCLFEEGEIRTTPSAVDITPEYAVLAILGKRNQEFLGNLFPQKKENDAALIRLAFSRWGTQLTEYLTGEFSLLIWERPSRQLWVFRDRFGLLPFYYIFQPNGFFCFADRIAALSKFTKNIAGLDPQKIKEYLTPPSSYQPFSDRTFYRNVKAALPGHVLHIKGSTVMQEAYWTLDPGQFRNHTESERIEQFKTLFFASVERCIDGFNTVGTHLSGGLDSSSIACVARQFRESVATFYVNPGVASTDETFYVDSVVKKIHPRHFEVHPRQNMYEALSQLTELFDRPDHFVTASGFLLASADQAKAIGCDLMLTGHDGDSVVGHGNQLLDTYFQTRDWTNLQWALKAYATARDLRTLDPDWLLLTPEQREYRYRQYFFYKELWKILKTKNLSQFFQTAQLIRRKFAFSYTDFMQFIQGIIVSKFHRRPLGSLLTNELVYYSGEPDTNAEALYQTMEDEYVFQFRAITNQAYIDVIEQMYHIGLHYGHAYAHPFFDEKLVELSLAIPERMKFGDGMGRESLRRALKGILPEEVRTRGFKTCFNEYGLLTFKELYLQTQEVFTEEHTLWRWVNRTHFLQIKDLIFNPKIPVFNKMSHCNSANRVLYLGIWLDQLKNREE
ncbi:asparagine synthase-related protein [Runella slithyformis]|uniref:asparagine synthase (glutamine-hydrolyzing) n=1 Tax=Runella slithyformis (strain ATCC 29530 / DSM 19594 / LMG 11500 / NCIMB 11436 / LSU 4) TaxID=761193 RepID=A0A7U3ZMB5_RUNSL|nr:asparagine synthase-related protein [Runella slithyformis]AEI49851.1 asparagine synthase [Runella slithyformis DSM 19594]